MKKIKTIEATNATSTFKRRHGLNRALPLPVLALGLLFFLAPSGASAADLIVKVDEGGSPVTGASVIVQTVVNKVVSNGQTKAGSFTAEDLKNGATFQVSVDYKNERKIQGVTLNDEDMTITFTWE